MILPPNIKLLLIEGNFQVVAEDFIGQNASIGIAFRKTDDVQNFANGIIPLPLGAFLMHADNPNCMLVTRDVNWYLFAVRNILIHHPLTINYNLYFI